MTKAQRLARQVLGYSETEIVKEEIEEASKSPQPQRNILVHSCFNQRDGQKKPRKCTCDEHITFVEMRELLDGGAAHFLKFKRYGKEEENRHVIVLTAEEIARRAHAHDALNHKLPLSLSAPDRKSSQDWDNYHMAPITSEVGGETGLNREIQNVRRGEIADRKKEVNAHRHRVGQANFRGGSGGCEVGVYGEVEAGGNWKKCNAPDSSDYRNDLTPGTQLSSAPDPNYGGARPHLGKGAAKPVVEDNAQNVPAEVANPRLPNRSLPVPIDKRIGMLEKTEFQHEHPEQTILE